MPVILSSPSRIHFGLFSVGRKVHRQFGGIGLMVQTPRTEIKVSEAQRLTVTGPCAQDCRDAIESWFHRIGPTREMIRHLRASNDTFEQLPAHVQVCSLPPRHCGLGSGTQLALCTVAALTRFLRFPMPSPEELATSVKRGQRSAIGSYGFFQGGLLVDRGKKQNEPIAPLDFRTNFPEHWPILLIMLRNTEGLSGVSETDAFQKLPDSDPDQRRQMVAMVRDSLIPGVLNQDYELFANTVYEFGRQSGLFFKSVQGGPYNGKEVTEVVQAILDAGVAAVGQTSWGPCVYAITRDDKQAHALQATIGQQFGDRFEIITTQADNRGVRMD